MDPGLRSISVVVPVYNEAENVEAFFQRLVPVLTGLDVDFQIIVVDDGSRDGTCDLVPAIASSRGRCEVVRLSRNFGHQIALSAGLDVASGDAVITMDGDLQHPPELIPELIESFLAGHDIVYTVRTQTDRESFFKRTSSRLFYLVFNLLSPVAILEASSDFRLVGRRALDVIKTMPERHRLLRGLFPWMGLRSSVVNYQAGARHAGTTKYPASRMLAMALDAAFSFSRLPLQLASVCGCLSSILCVGYFFYALWGWYIGRGNVVGWTSLVATVLFLGSLQLVFLGVLGEYVGRIYEEIKRRPLYVIQERRDIPARES